MKIHPDSKLLASVKKFGLFFCLAALTACAGNTTDDLPEVSEDGLVRVKEAKADIVYRSPNADFSQYNRVYIGDITVAFEADWLKDQNMERRSLSHKLTQEDADRIKAAVAESFRRIFIQELEEHGYRVASQFDSKGANEDLLVLKPAILDLDVAAPDTMSAGRNRTYTASAGSMTLAMEFHDSITGDLLGRVKDSKEAPDPGRMQISNSVTNKADGERMLRKWAAMLADALDRAHDK